jgi:hypothetical protein
MLFLSLQCRPDRKIQVRHPPTSSDTGNERWRPPNRTFWHVAFPVSVDVSGYQHGVHRSGRHRKHTNNILNLVSIHNRTRDTSTSGLATAFFRFRCRTMSEGVGLEFIGLTDSVNLKITFRISFLYTIDREI